MDSDANHDGAMYFISEIFPIVKKSCTDAIVYMVGRAPKRELSDKHNGDDIVVTGMVDSVYKYYQNAAVAIVPLRSGEARVLKYLRLWLQGYLLSQQE